MIAENLEIRGSDLYFAGRRTADLAARYGTPLYVMDEATVRRNCRRYREAMRAAFGESALPLYASKACCFKEIYRIVGITVLAVGTAISPFLPKLIHGDIPPDVNLYVLYFLFLANTGLSYLLFAYKTALLESLQRVDLTKIADSIVNIAQHILQIVVLFCFKN